jgi:hypothetical protein
MDFFEEEGEVVVLDVLMQDDVALAVDDADVHGAGRGWRGWKLLSCGLVERGADETRRLARLGSRRAVLSFLRVDRPRGGGDA